MKRHNQSAGFTLAEFLIVVSTLGIVGSLVARLFFSEQIHAWEDEQSPLLKWGMGLFVCLFLYFRFVDDLKETKREGKPVVRKSVITFTAISATFVISFFLYHWISRSL